MRKRLAVVFTAVALLALDCAMGAQTGGVIFHSFESIPFQARGRMQLKAVVTDEGSIGLAEVPAGAIQAGHRHQQEQAVVVVSGAIQYSISEQLHKIGLHGGALPPSNSQHFYTNINDGPSRFIEYQPVRRHDWIPPFPANQSAQSAEPVAVAPDKTVARDLSLSSGGWARLMNTGARVKSLPGETILLRMIDLSANNASLDMTASGGRAWFLYVLEGEAQFSAGKTSRKIGRDTVVQIANGQVFTLRSPKNGPSLIAAFSPVP